MNGAMAIFYLLMCAGVGWFNKAKRNRPFWRGFVGSLIVSPLIGIIWVYFTSPLEEEDEAVSASSDTSKSESEKFCPECGEGLQAGAEFCASCGAEL